jgi:hypothetical protein
MGMCTEIVEIDGDMYRDGGEIHIEIDGDTHRDGWRYMDIYTEIVKICIEIVEIDGDMQR